MSITVQLLGRPRIMRASRDAYRFRSRKSWGLLAYLMLSERPPTRSQLGSLLFADADDPARALRWCLSEIRRALAGDGSVDGDPVMLRLSPGAIADVEVVVKGAWADAVGLPGLGADLLEGMAVKGAAAFETWLLSQQRPLAAASEAILHEAALGSMARGALDAAIGYAVRVAAMSPLDENHQALLIRLYRMAGDDDAAAKQFAACAKTLDTELGVAPGPAVQAVMRETAYTRDQPADDTTIQAIVEAGSAAVSAGAVDAGVQALRTAARLADSAGATRLRVSSRLVLAEALVHALGGLDEAGQATLHEADEIALAYDLPDASAQARAELGYVDFLRGQYDRAEVWLTDALKSAGGSALVRAKALTCLGAVENDRGNYRTSAGLLEQAVELARAAGEPRRHAYALALLGRVSLFLGVTDAAAEQLDASIALAERDHWLAVLPRPQALRGEVQLARATRSERLSSLSRRSPGPASSAIRAGKGSPRGAWPWRPTRQATPSTRSRCWPTPGPAATGWPTPTSGSTATFSMRSAPSACGTATRAWIEALRNLASRTGMKGFTRSSLRHGAALGDEGDAAAAVLLAADIEAPGPHGT